MDREALSKNRIVPVVLLGLVVVIWGAVGYRAWTATQQTALRPPGTASRALAEPRPRQEYSDEFRDPFRPLVAMTPVRQAAPARQPDGLSGAMQDDRVPSEPIGWDEEPLPEEPEAEPAPQPPQWVLRGVVGDAALIESQEGVTRLVHVGDRVEDAEITKIQTQFITVEREGQFFLLFLE